jgi:hypothetical protein
MDLLKPRCAAQICLRSSQGLLQATGARFVGRSSSLAAALGMAKKSFQTVLGFTHTLLLLKSNLNVQQPGLRLQRLTG